jgi:hypothetical protein
MAAAVAAIRAIFFIRGGYPQTSIVKRSGAQAFSIRYTGQSGKFRAARDTHT